jgi:hypothetical integral membrane protein (TIGR02206 family)
VPLFGPAHLAILAAIPISAVLLSRLARSRPAAVRLCLGALLAANELVWYAFRYSNEGNRFPEGLPLQLCDVTLWLAVAALLTLNRSCFEFAWYAGMAGSGMAVLTPDLWAPCPSYPTIYFFAAHGGMLAGLLLLVWGKYLRPGPGSMLRALAMLNAYGLALGVFNAVFHTNYVYLCRKPASASALDWFGPWPWYLLAGEAAAAALFLLLWLPFRKTR